MIRFCLNAAASFVLGGCLLVGVSTSAAEIVREGPPLGLICYGQIGLGGAIVEQNAMWESAMEDYGFSSNPFSGHRGMQTVLINVNCPSDPSAAQLHWTNEGRLVACTNYLGVNGVDYRTRDGIFTYDIPIRLAEIGDGQSNTLMIGERPPSTDFWYGWWYATGQGSFSTGDVTLGVAELNPGTSGGISSYLEGCPPGPYS